ncbi:MAG: hypothetical protein MJ162_00280 [Treponema sp.]|nr:hypothetical protein [Treponema sp.]
MEKTPEVEKALSLVYQIIPYVEDAESQLMSARNWGFVDMMGGGLFTNLIKHSKLSNASADMNTVNCLMQELQNTLQSIEVPQDYRMNIGGFASFADFFFDGFLIDAYMLGQIFESLDHIQMLKGKLFQLRYCLEN